MVANILDSHINIKLMNAQCALHTSLAIPLGSDVFTFHRIPAELLLTPLSPLWAPGPLGPPRKWSVGAKTL